MTKEELVTISAYTGFMLLPTGEFGLIHEAIEKAMGRPVWTHELASPLLLEELRKKLWPEVEKIVDKAFKEERK